MSIKEALLREYLQDQFPASFHTMLLLPTEKAHVQDDYQKIFVCCGGALSYEIQSFESPENAMTAEQVVAIAETICAHHKEQRRRKQLLRQTARSLLQRKHLSNGCMNPSIGEALQLRRQSSLFPP